MPLKETGISSEVVKPLTMPPTVFVDAQPALSMKGIDAEQRFVRAILMAREDDVVLLNYQMDPLFIQYLAGLFGDNMPTITQLAHSGDNTLTEDILTNSDNFAKAQAALKDRHVQYFIQMDKEVELAEKLDNTNEGETSTYSKDIRGTEKLGSKAGFREFCQKYKVPMPAGAIIGSDNPAEIQQIIRQVQEEVRGKVMLKAGAPGATGGEEMHSNTTVTEADLQDVDAVVQLLQRVSPAQPPYVVEEKIKTPEGCTKPPEGSLHIFIDNDGNVVIPPTLYGQISEYNTYVGGYAPIDDVTMPEAMRKKIIDFANTTIVPALKAEGLTGFHCMDFLFDPQTRDFRFIEDNTRPGALDFIAHFADRVSDTFHPREPYAWMHHTLDIAGILRSQHIIGENEKFVTTFEEVQAIVGTDLDPRSGEFALLSVPDVLPFSYALHLTTVSTGEESSVEMAKQNYDRISKKIIDAFKTKRSRYQE